jgi:two-component system sensor histidine kinase/response regulator
MNNIDNVNIMIIDDNPMTLMIASKTLENKGYNTSTAESGILAFKQMENRTPSLILLDIMMPEMDGYEVCRKIKAEEKWKDIPVIFLTVLGETEDLVEGFIVGGVDYITKPFKSEELLIRVKNHLELAASKKKIIEMNCTRDNLYSIIAHDIRTPLAGILQTIDAIEQGYFDPCSQEFKNVMHHLRIRTFDTSSLLTSLLNWAQIQGQSIEMQFKINNVGHLIGNCIQLMEPIASNKNISIVANIPNDENVWCDEVSMQTVFRNILSNAIKFTPNNGKINVSVLKSTDSVDISINDTGVGMSAEAIRKVFEREEHFTTSGTENEQGTGLGLIMVKDFVKKNNGVINVRSNQGLGTTFTISLPKSNKH